MRELTCTLALIGIGGLAVVGGLWWLVARLSEADRRTEWYG